MLHKPFASFMTGRRALATTLVAFGVLLAGQAGAQEPPLEAEMGQALMQMQESEATGAVAAAGAGWYTCDVNRVGPGWGNVYLHLECGSAITPSRWFIARADQKRDMLAAGLTAMSSGKQVLVYLTGTAAYSEIRASYVVK